MGLDSSKASIAIARVSKTGHEKPLEGVLPQVKGIPFVLTLTLQFPSSFDDGSDHATKKPVRSSAGVHVETWNGKRFFVRKREQPVAKGRQHRSFSEFLSGFIGMQRDHTTRTCTTGWQQGNSRFR